MEFSLNQGEDTEDLANYDVAAEKEEVVIVFQTEAKQYCCI